MQTDGEYHAGLKYVRENLPSVVERNFKLASLHAKQTQNCTDLKNIVLPFPLETSSHVKKE